MKPLIHLTDDELKEAIVKQSDSVTFHYNDFIGELDRRSNRKATEASLMLSVVSVAIAVGAFILSALRP